jgi:hypothetical protein
MEAAAHEGCDGGGGGLAGAGLDGGPPADLHAA